MLIAIAVLCCRFRRSRIDCASCSAGLAMTWRCWMQERWATRWTRWPSARCLWRDMWREWSPGRCRSIQPASSYIHKTCIHTQVHSVYSFLKVSDYWLRVLLPPHPKKLPEIYFSDTLLRYHADRQVSDSPATLPYMWWSKLYRPTWNLVRCSIWTAT